MNTASSVHSDRQYQGHLKHLKLKGLEPKTIEDVASPKAQDWDETQERLSLRFALGWCDCRAKAPRRHRSLLRA